MAWFTTDWFSSHHTVRCAHKSGDVINFIIVACRISNYKNRLRLAKVIVKNNMSRFYGSVCISAKSVHLNDLSYGINTWADSSSVLSQSTRLTDGQTNVQTDTFLATRPPCIQSSAVKIPTAVKEKYRENEIVYTYVSMLHGTPS